MTYYIYIYIYIIYNIYYTLYNYILYIIIYNNILYMLYNIYIYIYIYIYSVFTTTCTGILNIIFFTYLMFFTLISINIHSYSTIDLHPSNLHLHRHEICLVNVCDSFVLAILLKTLFCFIWITYIIR